MSRGEVGAGGARLSPDPHEEGFELSFVQLLEGSVDISLVGGQNGHDVLTTKASPAAQLIVLQTSLIHDGLPYLIPSKTTYLLRKNTFLDRTHSVKIPSVTKYLPAKSLLIMFLKRRYTDKMLSIFLI